mgnify:FL=1
MIFLRRYKKYTGGIIYAQNDKPFFPVQSYFYIYYITINSIDIFGFNGYNKNDFSIKTHCANFTFIENSHGEYSATKNNKIYGTVCDYTGFQNDLIRRVKNSVIKIKITYYPHPGTILFGELSQQESIIYPNAEQHKALMKTRSLLQAV